MNSIQSERSETEKSQYGLHKQNTKSNNLMNMAATHNLHVSNSYLKKYPLNMVFI